MLPVKLIEVILKLFELLDHLVLAVNILQHLAFFQLETFLVDTLLGVQLGDLGLTVFGHMLRLAQLL